MTPEFSSYSFDGMFTRWLDDFQYSLKANAEYVVTFDGAEYWCTNIPYSDSEMGYTVSAKVLGNASLIKKGSPMAPIVKDDTGEPFVFYTYQNGGSYTTFLEASTDGEHTISIRTAEEIASPFDPKFLPAIRGTAFYVNVTQTDTDTYTADKTYDEISNAITNGLIPYCVYGNYLLPLVCSDGGVLSGIAPASLVPYAHHFVAVVSTGSPICVRVDINTDNNVYIEKQGLQLS